MILIILVILLIAFMLFSFGFLGGIPATMKKISSDEEMSCDEIEKFRKWNFEGSEGILKEYYKFLFNSYFKLSLTKLKYHKSFFKCGNISKLGITEDVYDTISDEFAKLKREDLTCEEIDTIKSKLNNDDKTFREALVINNIDFGGRVSRNLQECELLKNEAFNREDLDIIKNTLNKIITDELTCEDIENLYATYDNNIVNAVISLDTHQQLIKDFIKTCGPN